MKKTAIHVVGAASLGGTALRILWLPLNISIFQSFHIYREANLKPMRLTYIYINLSYAYINISYIYRNIS